ncbi:hypothetical protein TGPRC2_288270 [Toxoplasma gondii TgCatPRC2]|uniref:Uncharacterized protein n=1 Tax=Toxoplasma gondii TgCatPRC2 TaxID=1130821 RepID=A0A151HJD3_TOXGO|nr:hypothetical protein TGPRC2_288270 [Toxoplasma gondii TgCatPRC2]
MSMALSSDSRNIEKRRRRNGGQLAGKEVPVKLKKAKSGEVASVAEADADAQEQKQAQAEAKLRAICAAFWGDDEEESVPACSSSQAVVASEESETKKRRRSAESASERAGVSSQGGLRAVDHQDSGPTGNTQECSTRKKKGSSTSVESAVSSVGASPSVSPSNCDLQPKKRSRGGKNGFRDSSSTAGASSPDSTRPSCSVPWGFEFLGEEIQEIPSCDRTSATPRGSSSHAHGGFAARGSGKKDSGFHSSGNSRTGTPPGGAKSGRSPAGQGTNSAVVSADADRRKREEQEKKREKEMFDETVRDIRRLVYPHLGTFQRRQYVSAALRALGAKQLKGQKRLLPELRSRQAKTKANIAKRLEEEKHLGVSTHLDKRGNLQSGERYKKKQRDQKRGRQDLRNALGSAGQLDRKQVKKLRLKIS